MASSQGPCRSSARYLRRYRRRVLHLLAVLLPLALAAAVSPVRITEQAVILAAPDGRRPASSYAAGTAVVLSVLVGVLVTAGLSLSLPQRGGRLVVRGVVRLVGG